MEEPRHQGGPPLQSAPLRPQILRTLDIKVVLTGLEVWTEQDQSRVTPDANATLWAFLQWRRGLWARQPHDSAQLLTWVPPTPRGPRLAARTPGPPGHAALRSQGPSFPGRDSGPGTRRGHVPRGELWRRDDSEHHAVLKREERCWGVVLAARSDRSLALPGPLGVLHWCCSHHGPRDRPQPGPQPRPPRLLRGGGGGAGRLRDGGGYRVSSPARGAGGAGAGLPGGTWAFLCCLSVGEMVILVSSVKSG